MPKSATTPAEAIRRKALQAAVPVLALHIEREVYLAEQRRLSFNAIRFAVDTFIRSFIKR